MSNNVSEEYTPIFEIGVVDENPAVKIIGEYSICPTVLAALMTTLFETVMKSVEESNQNEYEKYFNKAFKILMKERHNYEITYKCIENNDK
jgi:hypothetical protein